MLRRGFIKSENQEPGIEGFEFYIDAFRELGTSRPVGLDLQAIPFTAIAEYFRIYGLEDFDEFVSVIRMMDNAYLEMHYASKKDEKGDGSGDRNANAKNRNSSERPRSKGSPR